MLTDADRARFPSLIPVIEGLLCEGNTGGIIVMCDELRELFEQRNALLEGVKEYFSAPHDSGRFAVRGKLLNLVASVEAPPA